MEPTKPSPQASTAAPPSVYRYTPISDKPPSKELHLSSIKTLGNNPTTTKSIVPPRPASSSSSTDDSNLFSDGSVEEQPPSNLDISSFNRDVSSKSGDRVVYEFDKPVSSSNSTQTSSRPPLSQPKTNGPTSFFDDAERFLEDNIRVFRVMAWAGPLLAVGILLSRSRGFRRINAYQALPQNHFLTHKTLRGVSKVRPFQGKASTAPTSRIVVNVIDAEKAAAAAASKMASLEKSKFSSSWLDYFKASAWSKAAPAVKLAEPEVNSTPLVPAAFTFHHTPLLREWLWFNPSSSVSQALNCELAGIKLVDDHAAQERFEQLVGSRLVYLKLVEQDNDAQTAISILKERKIVLGKDIGQQLLSEGFARLHIPDAHNDAQSSAVRILQQQLPSYFKAYQRAEESAKKKRVGVWKTLPPSPPSLLAAVPSTFKSMTAFLARMKRKRDTAAKKESAAASNNSPSKEPEKQKS